MTTHWSAPDEDDPVGETDIEVVGEAETGEDARDVRQLLPDVRVRPAPARREWHGGDRAHRPQPSQHPRGDRVGAGRRAAAEALAGSRAAGYIGKGCDAQSCCVVRDVAGPSLPGTSIAQNLALSTVEGNGSPFDSPPRELEVALLLTQGLRQEDIARRLSLSAKTVNTHKARLFEKMGIHDNIALARMASQYGLVDPARPL